MPANELARPNATVGGRPAEIAGAKSDPYAGIPATGGSFLNVLDQAREAAEPPVAPAPESTPARPEEQVQEAAAERSEARDESFSAKEERRIINETPVEQRVDDHSRTDERNAAHAKATSGAREKKDRNPRAELATEKNEKLVLVEKQKTAAAEKTVAPNEPEKPREKQATVWREMNRAFADLNVAAVAQHEQVKARSATAKAGDQSEQARAARGTESKGQRIQDQAEPKLNMVEKNLEKLRAKNDEPAPAKEHREAGRAEQAARQVYGFVREGAPDKNTEQLLLDPTKWSVHGRVGENAREGEPAKETRSPKNSERLERAIRMEVPKTTEETGHRETGGEPRQGFGAEREIFQGRFESAARLLENTEARQAALRESRELFNALVQKARVNLGPEGQSSATIRLKPEFLGNMTLNLRVDGNRVQAVLLVDNQNARKLLTDELESMRQELRGLGVQIDSFSIRVREGGLAEFNTGTEEQASGQAGTNDAPSDRQGRRETDDRETRRGQFDVPSTAGVAAESEYEVHLSGNGASGRVNLAV